MWAAVEHGAIHQKYQLAYLPGWSDPDFERQASLAIGDRERKWQMLAQEIEDRAALFRAIPEREKAAFFEAAAEAVMDLGQALEFDPAECRNKLEQVLQPELQSTLTVNAGLCGDCSHTRIIRSDRGTKFHRCQLSDIDSRFPKYPRLPVRSCAGYKVKEQAPWANSADA